MMRTVAMGNACAHAAWVRGNGVCYGLYSRKRRGKNAVSLNHSNEHQQFRIRTSTHYSILNKKMLSQQHN